MMPRDASFFDSYVSDRCFFSSLGSSQPGETRWRHLFWLRPFAINVNNQLNNQLKLHLSCTFRIHSIVEENSSMFIFFLKTAVIRILKLHFNCAFRIKNPFNSGGKQFNVFSLKTALIKIYISIVTSFGQKFVKRLFERITHMLLLF